MSTSSAVLRTSSVGAAVGRSEEARTIEAQFNRMHDRIDDLSLEELIQWFHDAGLVGRESWVLQAHILSAAKAKQQGKSDGSLRRLAEHFGISQSNASVYIKIWDTFGRRFIDTPEEDAHARMIGVSWYRTAAYADNPDEALQLAHERRKADPTYTIEDFRVEVPVAGGRQHRAPAQPRPTLTGPAPRPTYATITPVTTVPPRDTAHDGIVVTPAAAPTPFLRTLRPDEVPAIGGHDLTAEYLAFHDALLALIDATPRELFQTPPDRLAAELPPLDNEVGFDQRSMAIGLQWSLQLFAARVERAKGNGGAVGNAR